MMIVKIKDKNDILNLKKIEDFFNKEQIKVKTLEYDNSIYICTIGSNNQSIIPIDEDKVEIINNNDNYYFITRDFKKANTIITIDEILIGGKDLISIGGPCSVESKEQMDKIGEYLIKSNTQFLRGGIFKPRTSPFAFQGLGLEGLEIIKEITKKYKLPIVCELTSVEQVEELADNFALIQIGARNMQNFALLKAAARSKKPIILKRGFNATIEEWLNAAEYIFLEGNPNIILCERGIRSFENAYRNVTDLNAIVYLKQLTHLPVIIDPSHSTGRSEMVEKVALSCICAGVDGLLVETHYKPEIALSDGAQSLNESEYLALINKANKLKQFINSELEN